MTSRIIISDDGTHLGVASVINATNFHGKQISEHQTLLVVEEKYQVPRTYPLCMPDVNDDKYNWQDLTKGTLLKATQI